MSLTESVELLKSKILEEQWCQADAVALIEELSFLPLAITQAAAFICKNNVTVSEYLETMRASDDDAKELLSQHLEDPRRDLESENSVMRSWKLAYDHLSRNVPRAAGMLSL
ncbi:putative P-loop containing nucleoside triphosphate hydrolase [Rosellinia necatrix]|uniref:Putative P-loop containing nucleoside triphosphate hydrolase n=1 Tax=Rosellinia necatrix TaxID=77044 RepID=A0A1S8A8Y8_ROSNE|nr:putative P-loop containing nucleoside triphosphate hydrolase [Rosellinia necatrix]